MQKLIMLLFLVLVTIIISFNYNYVMGACEPSLTTASGPKAQKQICAGSLIFEENFDSLDPTIWRHDITLSGGGNWEFEWYTNNRSISYTDKGILHISPHLTSEYLGEKALTSVNLDVNGEGPGVMCTDARFWGCMRQGTPQNILNPIRSAKISTAESFAFKYGRLEVSAKTPTGDWLWPALWLLPRFNYYGSWPVSGEIDLMESRGNVNYEQNGQNIGTEQMGSTLHWGPDVWHNGFMKTHFAKNRPENRFNENFTKFQLIWTPTNVTFYVDNVPFGKVEPEKDLWTLGNFNVQDNPWKQSKSPIAPFDQEFYFVINVAVGGVNGYFPDNAVNIPYPKPWADSSQTAARDFWNKKDQWLQTWKLEQGDSSNFQIDYIRIWAL